MQYIWYVRICHAMYLKQFRSRYVHPTVNARQWANWEGCEIEEVGAEYENMFACSQGTLGDCGIYYETIIRCRSIKIRLPTARFSGIPGDIDRLDPS
jgi:hypothetical protein